jgi:hypothetical protein
MTWNRVRRSVTTSRLEPLGSALSIQVMLHPNPGTTQMQLERELGADLAASVLLIRRRCVRAFGWIAKANVSV